MIENFDLNNKIIVDLKQGIVVKEGGEEFLQLPEFINEYLLTNLYETEKHIENSLRRPSIWSAKNLLSPKDKEKTPPIKVYVSSMIKIRKVFFNSLMVLLNNFIPFIWEKDDKVISFKL